MNAQLAETRSPKQVQSDMVQLENSLDALRKEHESLKKQNEILQQEMDRKRTDYESYISGRERSYRENMGILSVAQKTLETQREEFKKVMDAHLKEKQALGAEKVSFLRDKTLMEGRRRLVDEFINAMRRAYNVLPD